MTTPSIAAVLQGLSEPTAALMSSVLSVANAGGVSVYLVGGPVRDMLLGSPIRDVDLLVEPTPGMSAAGLANGAAPQDAQVVVHQRFGTVTIRTEATSIDLATVRKESYAYSGSLPSVEEGTLEEDLRRRDFTVNALALPLSAPARVRFPGVIDLGSGLDDLANRRLNIMHDRSFHDDPTRALRAARLAPRLGFTLGRGSRSALRDALRDGAFGRVSGDRLRREFVKMFDEPRVGLDPVRALKLLSEWHVLGALEPGLTLAEDSIASLRRVGRCVERPPWDAARWRPWVTGLGVWFGPLAHQLRGRALRRIAVRGAVAERVVAMVTMREKVLHSLERARGRGAIDAVLRGLPEEELHALYAWAPPAVRRRIARYSTEDRYSRIPVTGSDLTGIGLTGPSVGRALERIRVAYLDGTLRTREEALSVAREIARRGYAASGARKPKRKSPLRSQQDSGKIRKPAVPSGSNEE